MSDDDDLIELKFNKEEAFKKIGDLFIKLKLEHQIHPEKKRMIFIRRSELDKTAPSFQDKILRFREDVNLP